MSAPRSLPIALLALMLSLTGCGQDSDGAGVGAATGVWRPVELLGRDYSDFVPVNGETTITLSADGQWEGNDGCNKIFGSLEIEASGHFRAEAESGTDVGCYPLAPREQLPNVPVVEQATTWRLDGQRLVLEADDGTVLGIYERTE